MDGMMMHRPLRIADILTYAEDTHGTSEVVSATVEGGIHRYTYRDMAARCRKLANALTANSLMAHAVMANVLMANAGHDRL